MAGRWCRGQEAGDAAARPPSCRARCRQVSSHMRHRRVRHCVRPAIHHRCKPRTRCARGRRDDRAKRDEHFCGAESVQAAQSAHRPPRARLSPHDEYHNRGDLVFWRPSLQRIGQLRENLYGRGASPVRRPGRLACRRLLPAAPCQGPEPCKFCCPVCRLWGCGSDASRGRRGRRLLAVLNVQAGRKHAGEGA